MQISEALSIHRSYQAEHSHSDILGDAFLLQNNLVYRRIKNHALKIGCTFAEARPEYLLMPFHQLGHILATKEVPYVPNARLLQSVENKRANVIAVEDLQIPESYHLHEAAHVVAEHFFEGHEFAESQEKILKAIICESFANSVDAMACASVDDDLHDFFLRHNCYMHPNKKSAAVFARLKNAVGARFTFMFTMFAYMHANYLQEVIPSHLISALVTQYAPETELSPKIFLDCEVLMRIAENLDPQFRILTTKMYLNLEGYDGDVFEILNYPFIKLFYANSVFAKALGAMADVVLN